MYEDSDSAMGYGRVIMVKRENKMIDAVFRFVSRLCVAFVASILMFSQLSAAEGSPWSWGVGVVGSEDVYRDFNSRVILVPLIIYRGDRLNLYGPYATYDVYRPGDVTASLILSPVFAGYSEGDSPVFDGMDDRGYSMAGGVGVAYRPGQWHFSVNAIHDLLGVYSGYETAARASYVIPAGSVFVEPGIGVEYQSRDYVDYYYGVTEAEARSWRPAYAPAGSTNPEISIAFFTRSLGGGTTRLQLTHTTYGKEISNSPLTDAEQSLGVNLSFGRMF